MADSRVQENAASDGTPDLALLRERNAQRLARLAGERTADVRLAGRILDQRDVAAAKCASGPVTHFDFDLAFQVHHVLPPRREVKVVVGEVCGRSTRIA